MAENFVQQELAAIGLESTFSWRDARAEIEIIVADDTGRILPIEVKSGSRTRAKHGGLPRNALPYRLLLALS
ncbi:DUF4143 domain-containing protein [Marinobacterium sp. D7]|nr:DUF4143 domain-containing protein [Marinobacterium ramblicola]